MQNTDAKHKKKCVEKCSFCDDFLWIIVFLMADNDSWELLEYNFGKNEQAIYMIMQYSLPIP